MQPYINPYLFQSPYSMNYGNSNGSVMQNPVVSSYQAQQLGITGKYVNDFSEIMASDVPMGGQPSIFVKNDRSEIQLREWSPNGQIVSTQYIPFIDNKKEETVAQSPNFDISAEIITPIFERMSVLEEKLDKLAKPVTVRAKKDGE